MKIGELVNFRSTYSPFQKEYESRNPGVILDVKGDCVQTSGGPPVQRPTATVMWANGEITSEHMTYLKSFEL